MSHLDNFLEMLDNNQAEKHNFSNLEYKTRAIYLGLDVPTNEVEITNAHVSFIFTTEGQFISLINYKE